MTYRWLSLLCSLALGSTPHASQAQEPFSYSRPQTALQDPVVVLNSTIIINGLASDFTDQDNQAITSVDVYHAPDSPNARVLAPQLQQLTSEGLIAVTAPKKRVRSQSFAQLGRQLGLRGPLLFAVNGHLLDPQAVAALRIAPAAIGQLHLVQPTAEVAATRVDIWLVAAKTGTSKYPAGTILLR